ncbi:uncharacterized protein LOC6730861 [Drosophila simulans]|uniref:GD23227 n=2 Tax=melanogaster subgroup TaxID=32351 RepID=B4Q9J9_DROSI|nr:uncharacterized protein LOC6730861 [Drosophila simulans]EDX03610.1 GD23227 [Drosophila simulans]KMY87887.1 uncharacterized protein Dsimw501_GD23227 [Drosophila simulans]
MASKDLTLKSDYSACSVIDDIISKSLPSQSVPRAHKRSTRISFRSLTRIIMTLIGNLKKATSFHEVKDIDYWRNLAESRSEVNNRYERLIKAQQNRIHTMETRLHTMINLARETQKMLAEIGAEKRASEERGHGEHAD